VAIFASAEGVKPLLKNSAAIDWVRDAFGHLKVIGHSAAAQPLFAKAGIGDDLDDGVIELDTRASIGQDIDAAKQQRVWDREARLALPDMSQDLGTQETTSVRAGIRTDGHRGRDLELFLFSPVNARRLFAARAFSITIDALASVALSSAS
jgi:hypothetical protein